ncbi:MAG: hypothetical protein K6C05_00640 [Anaerovibrio sp.]|uniref:hypothetical protein n=1 Tax=Anaerovibrio sp. TaxID=1872532 RepID=UPI0025D8E50E|nr:hypothetical protein [Anaerovibrio sp.]MCR5175335.1 hypothetical protein [Anaerovibrio sp.]
MDVNEIISSTYSDNREKMRSLSEITAKYNLSCKKYKELRNCKAEIREQKVMLYAELKALGWVLGKSDKTITRDAN